MNHQNRLIKEVVCKPGTECGEKLFNEIFNPLIQ